MSDTDSIGSAINRFGDWISGKLGLNSGSVPTNNLFVVGSPVVSDPNAEAQITAQSTSRKALVVQCQNAATVNVFEVQNNTGAAVMSVLQSGTTNCTTINPQNLRIQNSTTLTLAGTTVTVGGSNLIQRITSMTAATQTIKMYASPIAGDTVMFMDETGVVSGTNTVTFQNNAGVTVSGTSVMNTTNGLHMLFYNGSAWFGYRLF